MKRLQTLILNGENLEPNKFNRLNTLDKKSYAYVWRKQNYEKLYCVKSDIVLPFIDMYELRAQHRTGSLCGWAFDLFCKEPIVNTNFIIASNNIKSLSLKELKSSNNYFNLNHKLKGCNVYMLPNLATMLTLSLDLNMKDLLDL